MVSTVTLYRSPVRLVKHAAEEAEPYSSQAISRARKKVMAEIALGGDELITEDVAYSRNDAATLLDVVTEDKWKVHTIIYNHKGLLNFLEQEEFDADELQKADAYLYNSTFVQAVSPYFAHSFNAVSGKLIRQGEFEQLLRLLDFQGYILPEHSSDGYQKIRTYLDEQNYTLRNLSWEKFITDENVLHFVFSDSWKRFINKLPSSFTSLRDELVEQMTAIVLRFQHKATWHYLHQVLVQLKAIETNDFNHAEVVRIDDVIYKNSRIEGGKGSASSAKGGGSSGRIVWWVIWIVLMVIRAATCNNSNKTSYNFDSSGFRDLGRIQRETQATRLQERRNEKVLLNFFDSLSHRKNLASQSLPQPLLTGDQPFALFADNFNSLGSHQITVANTTDHNCVLLYFDGPSHQGTVYANILSHTYAAYIKKGEALTITANPDEGGFYFLFGEEWGRLNKEANLQMSSLNDASIVPLLPISAFFSNKNPVAQRYLTHSIYLQDPSSQSQSTSYKYLHKALPSSSDKTVSLQLIENAGKFSIQAGGGLNVKEDAGLVDDIELLQNLNEEKFPIKAIEDVKE